MKKKVLFLLIAIFLMTGCGVGATDTLSCSYETVTNDLSTRMIYNIDYEGTDVKKVRITYKYNQVNTIDENQEMDGVGTGTDGTTNDTQLDNDGIIDGVVGSTLDNIISGVTDVILDISGIRERHASIQNTYANTPGFSVQNVNDIDNTYTVTYVIDYDTITDNDLAGLNLSRNIDVLRGNYTSQGFTCK
jgi:hypothetical protein